MASGTIAWIKVFDEDICNIMQKPTGSNNTVESQKLRESENRISDTPKPPHEYATQRPSPRTPVREANVSAPSSAPTPVEPMRTPSRTAPTSRDFKNVVSHCPPPCSTLSA